MHGTASDPDSMLSGHRARRLLLLQSHLCLFAPETSTKKLTSMAEAACADQQAEGDCFSLRNVGQNKTRVEIGSMFNGSVGILQWFSNLLGHWQLQNRSHSQCHLSFTLRQTRWLRPHALRVALSVVRAPAC